MLDLGNNDNNGLNGNNNLNNNGRFVGIGKLALLLGFLMTDLFDTLCSYENLSLAFKKARRGKTQKQYVIDFEKNIHENLLILRNELLMQVYYPQPLKTFIIRDPKTRKISKSAFRDRVIHHALCNIIEPIFEKSFIYDSYTNRLGKGTLKAVARFDQFKRKASKNNTRTCYVLKADIKSYFETVDHTILFRLIQKKINDERILWLVKVILDNHHAGEYGKGMPLGNLTSQFFANVYLNELDQFVKHTLKVKYYIRYVDDFIILDTSKEALIKYKEEIGSFLVAKLCLHLHPSKSKIIPLSQGASFLGFRIFFHHKLLRKKNLNRFERRLSEFKKLYHTNKIQRETIIQRFDGWLAYTHHADTYKYQLHLLRLFPLLFPLPIKQTEKMRVQPKKFTIKVGGGAVPIQFASNPSFVQTWFVTSTNC